MNNLPKNDSSASPSFNKNTGDKNQSTSQDQIDKSIPNINDNRDLDIWNLEHNLSPDFNFLNVPDETFNFFQNHAPTSTTGSPNPSTLFGNPKQTNSETNNTPINKLSPTNALKSSEGHGSFYLNHYENILKQSKVPMKEALSPATATYISPSSNTALESPPGTTTLSSKNNQPQRTTTADSSIYSSTKLSQSQQSQQQSNPNLTPTCDHCRRRQIKCVTVPNLSNCVQCETKGIKCTYSESPSNPSLKRNMGITQDTNTFNNNFKRPKVSPSSTTNTSYHSSNQQQQQQQHTHIPPSVQKQRTSSSQQPVLQYPRSSFFVGQSSMYDSILLNRISLDKIDQVQLNRSLSLRKVSNSVQFILRDDFSDEIAFKAERYVDSIENLVAPHGPALINTYFKIIHPSFPILHKKVFLEKYSRSYREFSAPLLATVYSLACKWWDLDPSLSSYPKPDVEALNKIALTTFVEVTDRPRLSAVQAGLLLLQCRSEFQNNWILCQQIVSLAEELGLGLDCQDWKLPKWERGLRRRLAWAVWIQEKWTALIESRVSHFTIGRNWLVENISDDDFPEVPPGKPNLTEDEYKKLVGNVEVGRSMFKEMTQLSLILSEIMETFYSYSSSKELTRIDLILKAAKPLQLKLRQWYHGLPQELQMVSIKSNENGTQLSSNGCLHLSYLATEVSLHRRIISHLGKDVPPELVKVCRAAATTRLIAVIDFVKSLRKEHIFAFWHSSTTSNLAIVGTFAAILFVTSSTSQEASVFREHINTYRNLLQKLSKFFLPASNALQRIDTLLLKISGLVNTSNSPYATPNQFPLPSPGAHGSTSSALSPYLQHQNNNNNSNDFNNYNNDNNKNSIKGGNGGVSHSPKDQLIIASTEDPKRSPLNQRNGNTSSAQGSPHNHRINSN